MVDMFQMQFSGQVGALNATGAGGPSDGSGIHPNASTGTLLMAGGLFLGINKSDSGGFAQHVDGKGVVPGETKMVSWSSGRPENKWGDRIFKNAQEGVANASKGIEIGGAPVGAPNSGGGGGGFADLVASSNIIVSNVSSSESVVPVSTPRTGGGSSGFELS